MVRKTEKTVVASVIDWDKELEASKAVVESVGLVFEMLPPMRLSEYKSGRPKEGKDQ